MISGEDYRAETLSVIAGHLAKSGLYQKARATRDTILHEAYHAPFDASLPLYALSRGDIDEAINFTQHIRDEKEKAATLLCMAPHLEKLNQPQSARQFMREWAVGVFQNGW